MKGQVFKSQPFELFKRLGLEFYYLYCLFYFTGTKTSGADIFSSYAMVGLDFDPLQVRQKDTVRPVVCMADIFTGDPFLLAY
jgi:hypothetical protein